MFWSIALSLAACQGGRGTPPPVAAAPDPAPAPAPAPDAEQASITAAMHQRFDALSETRDHVIQGRLEEARASAARLADVREQQLPSEGWRPWLEQLDAEADRITEAQDLLGAAQGVGRLAQICGSCHAANEGGPSLEGAEGIPPQQWDEGQNMALHRWSVDWMWLGLITPDEDAWQRGGKALDDKPLVFRFEGDAPPTHRPQLEQLVYVVAGLALEAAPQERGEVLGQLIATCAECHDGR